MASLIRDVHLTRCEAERGTAVVAVHINIDPEALALRHEHVLPRPSVFADEEEQELATEGRLAEYTLTIPLDLWRQGFEAVATYVDPQVLDMLKRDITRSEVEGQVLSPSKPPHVEAIDRVRGRVDDYAEVVKRDQRSDGKSDRREGDL